MGDDVPPCIQLGNDVLAKSLGLTTVSGNPCYTAIRVKGMSVMLPWTLVMALLHLVVYVIMTQTSCAGNGHCFLSKSILIPHLPP